MDKGQYLSVDELDAVSTMLRTLDDAENNDIFKETVYFKVDVFDQNGESLGEISFLDGAYRWFPNGEDE